MKKKVEILLLFTLAFLFCSCASMKPAPEWKFEKDAILINITSHGQLNLFQGTPHTLVLCVYQLPDPNAFNQLIGESEGLSKLLECTRFDPTVSGYKKFVVQPGKDLNKSLDRAEGTKYVGIVAGYFAMQKDVARLFQIPVVEKRESWHSLKKVSMPGVLSIDLTLGPQEILDFRGE
jgi:type VI secretion system VasD/TssJ family lipoprotein